MSAPLWVALAAVGGVAALARFGVDGLVSSRAPGDFPSGTLAVNLTGAFVVGVLAALSLPPPASLLAETAAAGSYTTFATWLLESHRLAEDGEARATAANLGVSLALGLAAVAAGHAVGGLL